MNDRVLQISLSLVVFVAMMLVLAGRVIIPGGAWSGTLSATAVVLLYGGLATTGPKYLRQLNPRIVRWAAAFGITAGTVFVTEIVLEYVLLPVDNTRYGVIEFGTVFFLYFAAGLVAGCAARSVRDAILTATATAVIASVLWLVALLAVFYAFHGTPRQTLVLRAEGDFEDFARSGGRDFDAFLIEDLMGATFFHLLLGPLVAGVLGACGGLIGKAAAWTIARKR